MIISVLSVNIITTSSKIAPRFHLPLLACFWLLDSSSRGVFLQGDPYGPSTQVMKRQLVSRVVRVWALRSLGLRPYEILTSGWFSEPTWTLRVRCQVLVSAYMPDLVLRLSRWTWHA